MGLPMSSDANMLTDEDAVIVVSEVAKCYQVYARPQDRLRQAFLPRLRSLLELSPRKYFTEFWALNDVSFRINRGETVAIIGKNGSGKSTLLQVICGTLTPTGGSVAVQGRVAALLELGSGFNPEFTGRENVYLNGSVLGLTRSQVDERFEAIVAFADIGDFIDQPVKTYSSGMFVRLAFAVIANVDASVLVVDEALAVGDVFFSQKCMRFLHEFQEKGGTLVFVSHSWATVVSLCRRAIWLDNGRVVMDGPAKEVSEAYHASSYGMGVQALAAGGAREDADVTEATIDEDGQPPAFDRCDIRVFKFSDNRTSFGDGRAHIANVELQGSNGARVFQLGGGEEVRLVVEADVREAIANPIVGFFLKDSHGQQLFGTNTYLSGQGVQPPAAAGQRLHAAFAFRMPFLPAGNYTVDVAIADGTYLEHVQNVWAFDALALKSVSSTLSGGLVGIPYQAVTLAVQDGVDA
jgi:lipopolysaccharide transport system ATP-binding protein